MSSGPSSIIRSPPYERSGTAPLDPDHGLPTGPVDHETVIYVISELLASDPTPKPWGPQGDDETGDGTKAKPLATVDGVFKRFGHRAVEGERFLVKLGGGITEAEANAGVDPWDGQCSSMRQYATRGFVASGGEAYVNSFRWEGPLKGQLSLNQPTIAYLLAPSGSFPNGRTRWRYFGSPPPRGTLLRVRRNIGGSLVLVAFEAPITGNDADFLWTDFGNYYSGFVFEDTDTFDFIIRAAEFVPTSRPGTVDAPAGGGADGIMLQGWGAGNVYGRLGDTDFFSRNPAHTFTMVGFENLQMRAAHGVSFDRCTFYHSFNAFDSSPQFRGCGYDGQHPMVFVNCHVNLRGAPVINESVEFVGHATVPGVPQGNPPQYVGGNPLYPTVGGSDLYLYNENAAGGLQLRGGRWLVRKGLSVEGGLIVRDNGRFITVNDAYTIIISGTYPGGTAALHVKEDALAIVDTRQIAFPNEAANQLKVGIGAAIALGTEGAGEVGTFREVAGWNGNFSRRLEVNGGGKPTGDLSAIRDAAVWGNVA